ncbi:S-adenosyl-L-methionine:benzoic acid/salicylic acid carboxyl methyltransferase 3-like [Silene latifolia]|uniref:S-adenosyl-L-methionine:benzoic acid/salicylic acid carboxyl methyltransferase 3-like n=1 Tax=Silene latifolia TaxID=37657 RepID=UPI003D7737A7
MRKIDITIQNITKTNYLIHCSSNLSIYNMQVLASVGERRNTKEMDVENVFHMNKGVNHTSYAKNSLLQRTVTSKARPIIEESARKVYNTLRPECLMMAEMGCSSGPNALQVVSRIIDVIEKASRSINRQCPQFGVFLNDLPGNDFNTMFNLLPNFYKDLQEAKGSSCGPCFVSGIPKSFYGRVFPDKFLHFVHSSYSVHWLSQVPRGLVSENGEALNKGNIYIAKTSPPKIHKAYYAQFKSDFTLFLRLRSREMVSGGGMVLIFLGSIHSDDPDSVYELFGSTLHDMVLEGLIEEEKLDNFNLPLYSPTVDEVRKLVEAEGSFALNKLETITVDWGVDTSQSLDTQTEFVAKTVRAVIEPLLTIAFGHAVMDDLFLLFETRVKARMTEKRSELVTIVVSLTKKE